MAETRMKQSDNEIGTGTTGAGSQFTAARSKISDLAVQIEFYGNRIGTLFSMACALIVFLIAIHYMPAMQRMAIIGWHIVYDAVGYYKKISWSVAAIKFTATGVVDFVGGVLAYIALAIPAVLSAVSFWRGGVRLTRLIAGR